MLQPHETFFPFLFQFLKSDQLSCLRAFAYAVPPPTVIHQCNFYGSLSVLEQQLFTSGSPLPSRVWCAFSVTRAAVHHLFRNERSRTLLSGTGSPGATLFHLSVSRRLCPLFTVLPTPTLPHLAEVEGGSLTALPAPAGQHHARSSARQLQRRHLPDAAVGACGGRARA